jgi:hypothetical protein
LKKLAGEVNRKLENSERQMSFLMQLMESKVDTLMIELGTEKVRTATGNAKTASKIESLGVKLPSNLDEAQTNHQPLPETLDDIKGCIERLLDCTTSKGTHLKTKVKIIRELVMLDVYDGQCLSYLVSRMTGPVQRKNPYQRAMQIAKIIDHSGSVINLSGYDALRKGIEGDAAGKIERNGGWLVSKYHVMQAMTKVEIAAQEVIPFFSLPP